MPTPLLTFYLDQSPDHAGRYLHDLWAFSGDDLESQHDFIQWLFPLDAPSPVNPHAPALDTQTIHAFRNSPHHKQYLLRSLDLMLHFYGLKLHRHLENLPLISPADNFSQRASIWLRKNNHNHLRLTRILRSLHLLGLPLESVALRDCLFDIAKKNPTAVTETTLNFWRTAAQNNNLLQDDDFRRRLWSLTTFEYAEDFDKAFNDLYVAATPDQRAHLRSVENSPNSPRPRRFRNTDFPCRVDTRTVDQLRGQTLRLIRTESSPDFRDDLMSLAWHYHTAALLGLDPDAYFEQLESLASPYMAKLIYNFRTRSASGKAMNRWALYIANSPQGQYIEYRP